MSTKDFKQGMVAGAKPFGDKLDQLANVSESAVSDIQEGLDGVTEVVNIVLDDLSAQEKKRIYDLDEATDVSVLEDDEKEFLVAILTELANMIPTVSDLQKKYLLGVCSVANVAVQQTSINLACIENVENMKTQKILLRYVMEFLFVGEQNYDFLEKYEDDLFCYFSVNKRGISEIKESINRVFNAMGIEGIASRYNFAIVEEGPDYETEAISEDCDFEEDSIPDEIEVLNLTNIVQVAAGETLSYRYKEIHLGSLINCCGTLEFDNCIIVYNEKNAADEITIAEGATLSATNSTFICKDYDKNAQITLHANSNASFSGCRFIDCCMFLFSDQNATLNIENCELYNCYRGFVFFHGYNAGEVSINSTNILIDENIKKHDKQSPLICVPSSTCNINNICVSISTQDIETESPILDVRYGMVTSSSFVSCPHAVRAHVIENCLFENCKGELPIVATRVDERGSEMRTTVKSCVFDGCNNVIKADSDTLITQCKFYNCIDRVIYAPESSGIEVTFCEFINYKNTATDELQGQDNSDPIPAIRLYANKSATSSTIQKCIFDGVDINEGFLISAHVDGKVSDRTVRISECDFRNCVTRRASGKVIKTYGRYVGAFNKPHNELAISVGNCRGLDQIKKVGLGTCTDNTILQETIVAKTKVGATGVVAGVATLLGGPITGAAFAAVSALINKANKKEEELSSKAKSE